MAMTKRERDRRIKEAFKLLEGVHFNPVCDPEIQVTLDTVATFAFKEGIYSPEIDRRTKEVVSRIGNGWVSPIDKTVDQRG